MAARPARRAPVPRAQASDSLVTAAPSGEAAVSSRLISEACVVESVSFNMNSGNVSGTPAFPLSEGGIRV